MEGRRIVREGVRNKYWWLVGCGCSWRSVHGRSFLMIPYKTLMLRFIVLWFENILTTNIHESLLSR